MGNWDQTPHETQSTRPKPAFAKNIFADLTLTEFGRTANWPGAAGDNGIWLFDEAVSYAVDVR